MEEHQGTEFSVVLEEHQGIGFKALDKISLIRVGALGFQSWTALWVNIRSRVNKRGQYYEGVKLMVRLLYSLLRYHQGIYSITYKCSKPQHKGIGFSVVLEEHCMVV